MSVLLAGLMLLVATQATPPQTTGSISGVVQAADTQIPIPDARILITGPGVRDTTTADGSGRFTFTSLAPGVYRITIEKETFAYDVLGAPGVKIAAGVTANVRCRRAGQQSMCSSSITSNGQRRTETGPFANGSPPLVLLSCW